MRKQIDFSKIHHICICRTDSIGDVVLTLPLAGFLKRKSPSLFISFLCAPYTFDVVKCSKFVDKIISSDKLEEIHNNPLPDVVLYALPDIRIARYFSKMDSVCTVGSAHRWFHWLFCNYRVWFSRKKSHLHEAILNFHLLRCFGFPLPEVNEVPGLYGFELPKDYFLPSAVESKIKKPFFIIHPKSRGSAREWKEEHFEKLAGMLYESGFQVVLCGTGQEQESLKILPFLDCATNLMGKLTLKEYIALIASSCGLVAASTGPLHIAAMAGVKAAGLFPSLRPMHAGRWAPLGKQAKAFYFQKTEGCVKCLKKNHCECINSIRPEEIFTYLVP